MQNCKANGCPLKAEFVTHWQTDHEGRNVPKWGVCRYHRMTEPERWNEATRRLLLYAKMANALITIKTNADPLFMSLPGEGFNEWIERTERNLRDLVVGRIDPVDAAANFKKIINLLSN
jgi:glyoxylase-like metal-dependent hydrolase (beta-lactamase superfamily II)